MIYIYDKNYLPIVNCNLRSFKRNFATLSSAFYNCNLPSVLCLTETRFSSQSMTNISGYNAFHTIRDGETPAGGISLIIKDIIKPRIINSLSYSNTTIEICTAEFTFGTQNVVVLGIYRPHSNTIDNFNALF